MTLNFLNLDAAWLDRAVDWLDTHGAHPYALLEEWEVKDFRTRFASANGRGRLEMRPMLFYDGLDKIYLFDLMARAEAGQTMETIVDPSPRVQCVSPTPVPTLTFKD